MAYESRFDLDNFQLYQLARDFRKLCYQVVKRLPTEEKYCLGSQMRRAAISVTNNLAEGHSRWYHQENLRFCRISRGSVGELMDDFNICVDEQYLGEDEGERLKSKARELIARINSYMKYLQKLRDQDGNN